MRKNRKDQNAKNVYFSYKVHKQKRLHVLNPLKSFARIIRQNG